MNKLLKYIILTALFLTLMPVNVLAEDEEVISMKTSVVIGENGEINFTVSDGYAKLSPEFSLDCTIDNPEVVDPSGVVIESEYDNGVITFLVVKAGTYIIRKSTAKAYENFLDVTASVKNENVTSAKDETGKTVDAANGVLDIKSEEIEATEKLLSDFGLKKTDDVTVLDIYFTLDDAALSSVELKNEVEIVLTAPNEEKPNSDGFDGWEYDVLRLHDGKTEVIAEGLKADKNGNLVFKSDKFSVYAILAKEYQNKKGEEPKPSIPGKAENVKASPNTSVE